MSTCVTLLEVELERTPTLTLLWQRVWPRTELSGKRIVQATAETVVRVSDQGLSMLAA